MDSMPEKSGPYSPFFCAPQLSKGKTMPEEEVVTDQGQVETDQSEEEISEIVEGFSDESKDTDQEEDDQKDESEKTPSKSDESPLTGEVKQLKAQVHGLNRALHKARQEKKEPVQEEEQLSQDQLRALLKEHRDDPDTLFNIVNYIGKQAAKQESTQVLDAQKASKIKSDTDTFIHKRYPELEDESSIAYKKVDEIKQFYNLGDHPAGTYFAASAVIADNIESIKKQAFDEGKKAALGEKSEKNRKKNVKDSTLLETSRSSDKKSSGLSGTKKETADQLNLTPSQREVYKKLLKGKGA